MIAEERNRQIQEEDFTTEHDDQHTNAELAAAAISYAAPFRIYRKDDEDGGLRLSFRDPFPYEWDDKWDKRAAFGKTPDGELLPEPETYSPKEKIDLLAKAGALIAAEIDRLVRAEVYKELHALEETDGL